MRRRQSAREQVQESQYQRQQKRVHHLNADTELDEIHSGRDEESACRERYRIDSVEPWRLARRLFQGMLDAEDFAQGARHGQRHDNRGDQRGADHAQRK